jgi:adenylosuccinate synthase
VTSRDVTTAAALSNAGVPPQLVGDIYGSIRTYPIRVGDMYEGETMIGSSGPCYSDQAELSWDDLQMKSGTVHSLIERTTVTNKVRRVFTFSDNQFRKFLNVCGPTKLFVNFVNHINSADYGKRTWSELSVESQDFVRSLASMCKLNWYQTIPTARIAYLGTGEKMEDMVNLEDESL